MLVVEFIYFIKSLFVLAHHDCHCHLQVRAIAPFLGPPSDFAVVKMIPNERLPPRNLHRVRADKTQALLKWQPPYDSPNTPLVRHVAPTGTGLDGNQTRYFSVC